MDHITSHLKDQLDGAEIKADGMVDMVKQFWSVCDNNWKIPHEYAANIFARLARHENLPNKDALTKAIESPSTSKLRPWQRYILSKCPPDSMKEIPPHSWEQSAQWKFTNWDMFASDVVSCYGSIASVCLSLAYKPKTIVEMGVFSGHTSFLLCRANPDARVYGVDRVSIMWGTLLPTGYTVMLHGVNNFTLHIGESSEFKVDNVDLCYIDACHTGDAPYKDSLRAWENRNKNGDWCIAWDDYHPSNPDVVNAVDKFCKEVGMQLHRLSSWYYIGTLPHSAVEQYM